MAMAFSVNRIRPFKIDDQIALTQLLYGATRLYAKGGC
jgi:hypothetical protein